jgi:hypothetical protein
MLGKGVQNGTPHLEDGAASSQTFQNSEFPAVIILTEVRNPWLYREKSLTGKRQAVSLASKFSLGLGIPFCTECHQGSSLMTAYQYVLGAAMRGGRSILALVAVLMLPAMHVSAATIVDSQGFESPFFTTTFDGDGKLEGQTPATFNGTWLRTKGIASSTANIQTTVVDTGSQAVVVNRAADSDDRWGVLVQGYPAERYVCIDWRMRVQQTTGPANTFGPFFGVEAYDDDAATIGLLGSFGVDATTGDVLYQIQGTGDLTETGSVVNFGQWNSFHIQLDFFTDTAMFALNNTVIATTGFVDSGLNEFTDATISAIAAMGDAASQALVGQAFFDNFVVIDTSIPCLIPEPATWALAAIGLIAAGSRRRRRV